MFASRIFSENFEMRFFVGFPDVLTKNVKITQKNTKHSLTRTICCLNNLQVVECL